MPSLLFTIFLLHGYLFSSCVGEIATLNNQFGLRLYNKLAEKSDGDFVISPFPITTLLSLVLTGANGTTRDELRNALEFSGEEPDLVKDYRRVISDFQDIESLDGLNAEILLSDSLEIREEFEDSSYSDFSVIPYPVNFSSPGESISQINGWLSNATGHNESLLSEDFLQPNGSMILLSTSFFEGTWVNQFYPLNTKPSPFFYTHNRSVQVDMMFQRMQVPFALVEDLDCTIAALPYKLNSSSTNSSDQESRIDLVIVLPNKRDGIIELERKLKTYTISQIMRNFVETKDLFVYLPRFKLNFSREFSDTELQLDSPFNPKVADFAQIVSNSSDSSSAWISKVYQVSEFSVDEFGTNGVPPLAFQKDSVNHNSPESFRVNRPFIGILYDQERYIVLSIFRKNFKKD